MSRKSRTGVLVGFEFAAKESACRIMPEARNTS